MEKMVTVVTYLGLIGIPSIFAMTIFCIRSILKFFKTLNYISSAIKSEIRNDLIKDYEEYKKRGTITQVELDEWVNRYKSYHNLYGENGVLDNRYNAMIGLPITHVSN